MSTTPAIWPAWRYVADGLAEWKRFFLARAGEHQDAPRAGEYAASGGGY